ncbi:MAG TPA: type II toxin-antitoxin system Phd/YefM family antitoxin [Clostridiales bacterium]|nr:type II toxin-antitoxin system Phd/YefM family antitoxin [Clostridiales bacterium]
MPHIRPITVLRNTNEISELCHKLAEPIFITKNGYGDLVIMSIETYERKLALVEVYKKLAEADAQIKEGVPLLDGDKVLNEVRSKYVGKKV